MGGADDRSTTAWSGIGTDPDGDLVHVFHTSEVRWFAVGPLPLAVQDWFTSGGTVGRVEDRHDTYQLHGLNEIGAKRRDRGTLEVKVRRTLGDTVVLGHGLEGRLEEWSKWDPGEGVGIWQSPDAPWIDVRKVVFTRSFMPTDQEIILPANHRVRLFAGCDIEVAAVTVDGIETWTLALEAFGPDTGRLRALMSAWGTLLARSPLSIDFGSSFDRACGYPEWLDFVISQGFETKS